MNTARSVGCEVCSARMSWPSTNPPRICWSAYTAATVSVSVVPSANVTSTVLPTPSPSRSAQLSEIATSVGAAPARSPSTTSTSSTSPIAARSVTVTSSLLSPSLTGAAPMPTAAAVSGSSAISWAAAALELTAAEDRRRQHEVGVAEAGAHLVVDARAQRRREHGEQRHHGDADHQRGGRRGGPSRVAPGVLLGQPAGQAPRRRRARAPSAEATGPGGERRQRSAWPPAGAPLRARRARVARTCRSPALRSRRRPRPDAGHHAAATDLTRPLPPRRAGGQRADRDARRAGERAAIMRRHDADDHAGDDRQRPDGEPAGRQREAERVEHALQQPGDAEAGHARRRSTTITPTTSGLDGHDPAHLPPRGADGPQQRQLAGPLATVIVNVLLMLSTATTSAMPANTTRNVAEHVEEAEMRRAARR